MAEISVVVPSHDRPLRLRWLLNALEEQTLDRSRWEAVVVHDSGDDTESLLAGHPLTRAGVLRSVRLPAGTGVAARQRNVGWRAARAPLVAFTDDDCRPAPQWLERALAAALDNPGAIVQGTTRPDPDEAHLVAAPHARTQSIDPPGLWAQTCNIVYPRAVLEATGGFEEDMPAGEDTELALRAVASPARPGYVGAADAVVYHAVEAGSLIGKLRTIPRWQGLALVAKRHPEVRRHIFLGMFWRRSHAALPLALVGLLATRRRPGALLLVLPWVASALPAYGGGVRGRARAVAELPGRAVVDAAETAALLRGSARYRTFLA
jgi:GT2 family glycosyltransferase